MEIPTPILVLMPLGMLITGMLLGALIERFRWNKLIRDGRLPRPRDIRKD